MERLDEKTLSCHANCLNENRYIFQEMLAINTRINIVMGEKISIILAIENIGQCFANHTKISRSSKDKQ